MKPQHPGRVRVPMMQAHTLLCMASVWAKWGPQPQLSLPKCGQHRSYVWQGLAVDKQHRMAWKDFAEELHIALGRCIEQSALPGLQARADGPHWLPGLSLRPVLSHAGEVALDAGCRFLGRGGSQTTG